jgi:type II secretory pathway pseudopilin PulG
MKTSYRSGFTIIETTLFLGITGLLVIGVLVTTGASISTQRYRDSVSSLKSALQEQYNKVSATSNIRTSEWRCVGGVVDQSGVGDSRGRSDCQILGRIITSTDSQSKLLFRDIIGYVGSGSAVTSNDIEALSRYTISPSPIETQEYKIEWDALMGGETGSPKGFTVMILRSPVTGVIRTFTSPDRLVPDRDLQTLINQEALGAELEICVRPNGLSVTGGVLAVGIKKGATSASGVESMGEEFNSCR